MQKQKESTDGVLFGANEATTQLEWNREKLIKALLKETSIDPKLAQIISIEVENSIKSSGIKYLTTPLIREITNAKMGEYGFEKERRNNSRIGIPIYDIGNIITAHNKENANVPHGPEATNLTIAEAIKKEYALTKVFSSDIAKAHISGDIHLHDLGMVDRPYCSGQSIEYIKKFGLNLPNAISIAKPSKHAFVLIGHLLKMSAALQCSFAGAIGWDAVNIFMAPYLSEIKHDQRQLRQIAQYLIFEFAQQSVARGGQSIFSDLNIYWDIPKHFANVKAIGPGGLYTGNTYSDYVEESQAFANALYDVYMEGDATGRPFFFPKAEVHITDNFFKMEGNEEFLEKLAAVSADKGSPYYVFDRGETAKISECCRLSFKLEQSDLDDANTPWKMRYSALQNVTLNLPRLGYAAKGSERKIFDLITEKMDIIARAHVEKKEFIQSLLDLKQRGPLSLLAMEVDGEPYYRMHRASFLVGMLGLNELVQYVTRQELHSSPEAIKFGLKVIAHMNQETKRLSDEYGLHFVLEQTPAESTAYRMAKLDLQQYPLETSQVVKGSISNGSIYYTNSTLMNVGAMISPIRRVKEEGLFHPLIEAGAISHVWLGESNPSPESIANFVKKTHENTQNSQITFSPEFTSCSNCFKTTRGLSEKCPYCGSIETEGITRVTGYFSKTSSWNKGKVAELHDRYKNKNQFAC